MDKSFLIRCSLFLLSTSLIFCGHAQMRDQDPNIFPEVRVALLGDTGAGESFAQVLKLVAREKSDVVMINGDFGYGSSPADWKKRLVSSIDTNQFPIVGTLGNHDVENNNAKAYIDIFKSLRNDQNGLNRKCTGLGEIKQGQDIVAADEVCSFENVSLIGSAIGQILNENYFESRLEQKLMAVPPGNWSLVGYHFTLASMNPGLKSDQNTYNFFDLIRKYGAIGAQAHTHSVMASCPIASPFAKGALVKCHSSFSNLNERFILPGTGMYLDSSVGGKDSRSRGRCSTGGEADCRHLVDLVSTEAYTRTDGTKKTNFDRNGALFMIFNVGGDATKALVYFKSVDGQEIFRFNIHR